MNANHGSLVLTVQVTRQWKILDFMSFSDVTYVDMVIINEKDFAVALHISSKLGFSDDLIFSFRQYVVCQPELIFVIYIIKRTTREFTYNHAGELKKLLAAETGLQPGKQLLTFKGKD
ncbi:hypothetical protein MKX01_002379 [Papaver californicum]|nr:hypothetical protein MKX01_002379 [Papaver californicum]